MTTETPHRAGYVALLGRPNVGKSTLLNGLLGQKLSITTRKPQTTRHRILGIKSLPGVQLLFLDTPGVHHARKAINAAMMGAVRSAIADADVVVAMVEAGEEGGGTAGTDDGLLLDLLKEWSARRGEAGAGVVVAINKVDRVRKDLLLPQTAAWAERLPEAAIVPVSALRGDGLERLEREIIARLPEGPALYPEEQLTDLNERFFVAEIIREKIFQLTGEEIPYASAVTIDAFEEAPERKLARIQATIHVERDSQKGIVIGKGGAKLKEIGTAARLEAERFLGMKVFLKLWVKVDPHWTRDEKEVRRLGMGG